MAEKIIDRFEGDFFSADFLDLIDLRRQTESYSWLPIDVDKLYSNSIAKYLISNAEYYREYTKFGVSYIDSIKVAEDYIHAAGTYASDVSEKRGDLLDRIDETISDSIRKNITKKGPMC